MSRNQMYNSDRTTDGSTENIALSNGHVSFNLTPSSDNLAFEPSTPGNRRPVDSRPDRPMPEYRRPPPGDMNDSAPRSKAKSGKNRRPSDDSRPTSRKQPVEPEYRPSGARYNVGVVNKAYQPSYYPTSHARTIQYPETYSYGSGPPVVEQYAPPVKRQPRVKMVIGLGIIQIFIGVIAYIANITAIAAEGLGMIYSGFWVGSCLILAGILGIAAGKTCDFKFCVATMITSIFACCTSLGGIALLLQLVYTGDMTVQDRVTAYGYIRTFCFIFGMSMFACVAEATFCGPCCFKPDKKPKVMFYPN